MIDLIVDYGSGGWGKDSVLYKTDLVPRIGDRIEINYGEYEVKSVSWNIEKREVTVICD